MKEKNQAFVEMESIPTAMSVVQYYAAGNPAIIHGQQIDVHFSARQEVTQKVPGAAGVCAYPIDKENASLFSAGCCTWKHPSCDDIVHDTADRL